MIVGGWRKHTTLAGQYSPLPAYPLRRAALLLSRPPGSAVIWMAPTWDSVARVPYACCPSCTDFLSSSLLH
jgi:hypothetical protein